jgi:hypothetical protein
VEEHDVLVLGDHRERREPVAHFGPGRASSRAHGLGLHAQLYPLRKTSWRRTLQRAKPSIEKDNPAEAKAPRRGRLVREKRNRRARFLVPPTSSPPTARGGRRPPPCPRPRGRRRSNLA